MSANEQLPEVTLDRNNLYQEETFSDRQAGSIQRLSPVNSDGSRDTSRTTVYVGQAQLMTPAGALPLTFELNAGSLDEAIGLFPEAANQAMEQAVEELKNLRRDQASSIVTPESGMGGGDMGGSQGGGSPIFRP